MPNVFDMCLITDVIRQLQTLTAEEICDHNVHRSKRKRVHRALKTALPPPFE